MLKEKNSLLTFEIKERKSVMRQFLRNIYESLYSLFDSILEQPIENMWYESIIIILGYLQLIIYIFDKTVSKSTKLFLPILKYSFIQFGNKTQY